MRQRLIENCSEPPDFTVIATVPFSGCTEGTFVRVGQCHGTDRTKHESNGHSDHWEILVLRAA
ncbi:hypothetical protein SPHV1_180024 [Novosphingobium sp. KN65.2]|nr:hypothetical protein SPHV1_180024 [Novosphingobium sp. KN65.2]